MKYHDDGCDAAEAAINEWLGKHVEDFRRLADECDEVALDAYRGETGFSPDSIDSILCDELHYLVWLAETYKAEAERSET